MCVVSSNEDAQQEQGNTMEAESDHKTQSQDSGYASQPTDSIYLGQNLKITACANQGGRKYMEDRLHVHVHRCPTTGVIDWTFVAVYDGHGGPEASEYCRQHLLKNIMSEKGFDSEVDDHLLEAIRNGFLKTHHTMWKEVDSWARTASGYSSTAGTTASCAFIRRGKVYIGHVGDSAILLTTRSDPDDYIRLTEDHKPELHKERKRIEASGGAIMQKQSVYRVVWTRPNNTHVGPIRRTTQVQTIPFLAVARSLGDFWSYVESTQEFAVSPSPDVSVTTLTSDHHSLLLASDGLTNVMSSDLEAAIMYELAAEEQQQMWFKDSNMPPNHARILMRRTMLNWRRFRADNVSVLAVIFDIEKSKDEEETEEEVEETLHNSVDAPVEVSLVADLDSQLADHPLCLMHVTNDKVMRYQTTPVPMRYGGIFDDKFSPVDSVGPGFVSHATENVALKEANNDEEGESWRQTRRLEQYYDMLGTGGERDVTPENQPPITSTHNLTNTTTIGPATAERRTSTVFTSAAAIIIDEMRRGSAAAAEGAEERPVTPENRTDVSFVVLRNSRSSTKRKSRLVTTEEDKEVPSTSNAGAVDDIDEEDADLSMDDSESEGAAEDEVHDAVLKLSLPFADAEEEARALLRTPSPIGDRMTSEGDEEETGSMAVRATPLCNTTSTEREVIRRVTRSAAATTSASSLREMVVLERPATRRSSARKLLEDAADSPAPSTALRTPKMVLEVEETHVSTVVSVATRTRSRHGEVTPPGCSSTPSKSTSVSGSRKRSRPGASTATPLMAKISLSAEMNENVSNESEESAKAGPSNKWKRANRTPLGKST